MLDIVAAIFAGSAYATVVGVLVGLSPAGKGAKLAAYSAAAAWLATVVAIAAAGGLAPGTFGPVPTGLLPFTALLLFLLAGWSFFPQFRDALRAVPLPALVGVNAVRLGGVLFLLLQADGRLSAPFAPSAGLGDIITGALAMLLAAAMLHGMAIRRGWLVAWNAFGAFDLVVAIVLGVLSAPATPFRLFTDGPGTLAMTELPWVLVPAALVPIFLLVHLAIAARLAASPSSQLSSRDEHMRGQPAKALREAHRTGESRGIGFPRVYDFLILLLTRGRERRYREDVLRLAGLAPGDRLLDIGCGTGGQAIAAWRKVQPGGSVVGVDVSEPMLAAARRKARRAGLDLSFRHADAAELPFADGSFDVVTVSTVLHMVPDAMHRLCLSEAARVLRPGGRLLLIDYAGDVADRRHLSAKHGPHGRFDLHRLRDAVGAVFTSVEGGPLGWLSLHYIRASKA